MYISGLSFVLVIQKPSVDKEFQLVSHGFGEKKKYAKKHEVSNFKTETIL